MYGFVFSVAMAVSVVSANNEVPQGSEGAKWHSDYAVAWEAARKAQRPLLIVIDAPREATARVEQVAQSGDKAQRELLAAYELCHIDVTTEYGRRVAQSFKTPYYPYTAVIDKTGAMILFSKTGSFTPDAWSQTLVSYKSGEVKNVSSMKSEAAATMRTRSCPRCR